MMDLDPFDDASARLRDWFDSLPGTTFHPGITIADLRHRGCGRGIIACEDIEPDMVLFTIPRASILTIHTSSLAQALPHIFDPSSSSPPDTDEIDPDQAHTPWSHLVLALIFEHLLGASSPWNAYLATLPAEFDTPLFWTAAEIAELQASPVVGRIGRAEADALIARKVLPVVRRHEGVFFPEGAPVLGDEELMALAHRMGSAVMAYGFDLEKEDDEEEEAEAEDGWVEDNEWRRLIGMVPMADVLNADAQFNAHVSHEHDCLTVRSVRTIRAGDEILNYYGPRPNAELLRQYGYVTQDHARYDVVEIPWPAVLSALGATLNLADAAWAAVLARIDPDDGDDFDDGFVLERDAPDIGPDGTFSGPAVLREMPPALVGQIKTVLRAARRCDERLVPDKRKRNGVVQAAMLRCLRGMAAVYGTSIEEDVHCLAKGRVAGRARMAVLVRLGEKQLIQEAIALVQASGGDDTQGDVRATKRIKR